TVLAVPSETASRRPSGLNAIRVPANGGPIGLEPATSHMTTSEKPVAASTRPSGLNAISVVYRSLPRIGSSAGAFPARGRSTISPASQVEGPQPAAAAIRPASGANASASGARGHGVATTTGAAIDFSDAASQVLSSIPLNDVSAVLATLPDNTARPSRANAKFRIRSACAADEPTVR